MSWKPVALNNWISFLNHETPLESIPTPISRKTDRHFYRCDPCRYPFYPTFESQHLKKLCKSRETHCRAHSADSTKNNHCIPSKSSERISAGSEEGLAKKRTKT